MNLEGVIMIKTNEKHSSDDDVQKILQELDDEVKEQKKQQQKSSLDIWKMPKIDIHCHIGKDVDGKTQTISEILENMNVFNVKYSVIFPLNSEPKDGFKKENEQIASIMKQDPSLIGFARLDPNHPDVLKEMKHAKKIGLKGFKLHPKAQRFHLDKIYDIYEKGTKLRLPFIIHSAHKQGLYQKQLNNVVPSFPTLTMILAHAGLGDQKPVIDLVQQYDNAYVDISANHKHDMQLVLLSAGAEKILFGSDAPYQSIEITLERLHLDWSSDRAIEQVMYKNAEKILGLNI